jgi:DNA modification methylase
MIDEIIGSDSAKVEYSTAEKSGDGWTMKLGDCVERVREIGDGAVQLSVFSPPFASLYTYSASDRDMGNSRNYDEFFAHFRFLIPEILRITQPGRRCLVHCQQVTTTKTTHGVIGWRDFRADIVRAYVDSGWVYDGEVVIDKDPQAQAIRTKSKALMFVQKNKDSSWCRPAMADYILCFRHPGDNTVPIVPDVSNEEWIQWARPIWYGIRESDTLNAAAARTEKDERHICPLQLGTIERCVRLWSNPGETVFSPFAGIGSEGYVALQYDRKFIGIELKPEYWRQACVNLANAKRQIDLFAQTV